ncbi:toll/interleukin-1 receptor domain-containing protein [Frankia sp. Cj3]|uniref:toll/interleukin-1 receptor domain-containing protein n=1 Tax=Frankia sp. Cj3 TaxID=2880976 RepID=UPI001EF492E5|nr:toll/interleukin-1 receptor domain-containing protein [Frankia sp. Cj3]
MSYTEADREWAEWIAWQLEEAGGFRVLVQAWDLVPGTNFVVGMQNGVTRAARTVAVLSEAYGRSQFGTAEWQAAWAADPAGIARRLLVVRVEDCPRPGILGQVVSFDVFDRSPQQAREDLVAWARLAVSGGRAKPTVEPIFPGSTGATAGPTFPAAPLPYPPSAGASAAGGIRVGDVSAPGGGIAVGVNFGQIVQRRAGRQPPADATREDAKPDQGDTQQNGGVS